MSGIVNKMVMSDMDVFSEAEEMKTEFVRLWFEKHMSNYGALVPTGDGEFIIEFPMPGHSSLCKTSEMPRGLNVNGVEFSVSELMEMYKLLNKIATGD